VFERERQILEDLADLASIRESLAVIEGQNATILKNQETLMSGLSDAQAALAAQGTDITALLAEQNTFLTDIQNAVAAGDSDAAVEAIAQQISANNAQIESVTSALQAGDPANATATTAAPATGSTPSGS
jgi:peptidoglycan hydrolase CwlO-like protein